MKKYGFLTSCLLLLATNFATAQTPTPDQAASQTTAPVANFVLKGRVVDAETGAPLAFATLGIQSLGLSTATNNDGYWRISLPQKAKNETLLFRYMGYSNKNVLISTISDEITIRLEPKSYQINEVVVTRKDFCKEFLQKAWNAIPENYPIEPTLSEGFYRETQRLKDSTFLYFNEAVLSVYKNTYRNIRNFGQIKVEKSRKNVFPGIDSINDVRFYGGPHFPNDLDIVFSRWDFIKPSEYSNWKIELTGNLRDSTSNIYVLSFKHKTLPNSNFQGKMYIDRDNYAFVGFDFWRQGLSALTSTQYPDMEYIPGMTSIKIGYSQQQGRYFLSYINYKTNGYNTVSQKRVFKDIDYVTTSQQTEAAKPIPFNEQFDYTDILSIEAQPYDSSYWKDYNILEESKLMQNQTNLTYNKEDAIKQLTTVYNKELTDEEKVLLFLKRFTFDGGFAYLPIRFANGIQSLTYGSNNFEDCVANVGTFGISTMDGIRFDLNKRWAIFSRISSVLYGFEQFQADLGINYRVSLAPSGRWIFLDLGLAVSTSNSKLEFGTITNSTSNLTLKGKTFDSEKLVLKAGKSEYGVKPSIGLAVRMGKQYELFSEATWFGLKPKFLEHNYLQIKEKTGGWFNKQSIKIDWNDSSLQYQLNGQNKTSNPFEVNPFNFRIGIRSGF
jgi:hypothetical protein